VHIPVKSIARWLAPSAVAACAGALVAGFVEGIPFGALESFAVAGFLAMLAIPIVIAALAVMRLLWRAWHPASLEIVEDDGGGAPRLAAWVIVFGIDALVLAWAMYQGTWALAAWTAFKPITLGFLEPALAMAACLVLVAVSRPMARGLTAVIRNLDARWRRPRVMDPRGPARGPDLAAAQRSLVTPWRILGGATAVFVGGGYAIWRVAVKPRLGPLDLDFLDAPIAGAVIAVAVQIAWSRLPAGRKPATLAIGGATAIVLASAVFALFARPSMTLAIWGDRPIAGYAIDHLFDLDWIRSGVPLEEFRPTPITGAPHPDIVLITIDTVRADHTPPYGGSTDMPAIRDLAQRGAVFEWAFSPSNVTRRSIPSMVIGLAPNRVRGRVVGWTLRVDPRHVLVAERLLAGGYDTVGFMCCAGFWGSEIRSGLSRGLSHLEIEQDGQKLADRARAWLDERERQPDRPPMFLWMHILEPHNWVALYGEPHSPDERKRNYDKALVASDRMVATVIGAFAQRPADKMPIVIVSADHGEALGEHGQPYHGTDLYDSQTHVPLVIAGPGILPHRIPETVSLTDLVPSLMAFAGFEPPTGKSMDGKSFADLATSKRVPDPNGGSAFAAMIKDRSNPGGITAVVLGRFKLIDKDGVAEVYDTRSDPDERTNLIGQKGAPVDPLRRFLRDKVQAADVSPFD
jgi:arylsulfatase A-like enzyme